MRTPVRADYFRRVVLFGRDPAVLGFSVRFPGRTPTRERMWLKAIGYEFSGRSWTRADRKPTRMTYVQRSEHTARMQARRRAGSLRGVGREQLEVCRG